ncbi:MAG: GntR family transcriptional regulator [Betaproteobacteria bacterium]|nr:GntR family transcriptional regulator [Betaproteobacteria bacterium]
MYQIETEDLGRKVYKVLRSMIINGDLRSGEKLVREELAARLGVSRTPLQFAISKLEQENLVETLPRRGAHVRQYSHKELLDIYDIRCRLEPLAARDAAINATAEDIEGLASVLAAFDAAVKDGDQQRLKRTDYEFHMELLRCCGNRFLFDMLATITIIVISNTKGLLKPAERSCMEHREVLEAIRQRDPDRAEALLYQHINEGRTNLASSSEYMIGTESAAA